MKITNIHTSTKWKNASEINKKLIKDLNTYAEFVEEDYGKIGLNTVLIVDKDRGIRLDLGADTVFGFLETHNILRLQLGSMGSDRCSPLIYKHNITLYAIFLLLDKYGYAGDNIVVNSNYVDRIDEDIVLEAQAQLINLQLI